MKKNYYVILDTETANSIDQPLPYDIGWVVCDRKGAIYEERSFVVAEVFCDMKDLMQSAYYADKIPQYYRDIKSGNRKIAPMWKIRRALKEDMEKYNTNKVGAYNMGFDKRALNNLMRYISKSWMRWFLPYGTEYFDIWHPACDLLMGRPSYFKFAEKHSLKTPCGNLQTSAEAAYKYITKNADFKESHTGLEDCKIETAIFAKCISQHKKMNTSINSFCWQIVQNRHKKYQTKKVK